VISWIVLVSATIHEVITNKHENHGSLIDSKAKALRYRKRNIGECPNYVTSKRDVTTARIAVIIL